MIEKIDKIQELLNLPNVDASAETTINNMKILNLLVDLRAEAEKLILSGVSKCLHQYLFPVNRHGDSQCTDCGKIISHLDL